MVIAKANDTSTRKRSVAVTIEETDYDKVRLIQKSLEKRRDESVSISSVIRLMIRSYNAPLKK